MATERLQRRIERLLDEVEEAADQQDWDTVHRLARQVLALDPDNIDAPAFLNVAELELGGAASTPSHSSPVDVTAKDTSPTVTAPAKVPRAEPPSAAAPDTPAPSATQPASFVGERYMVKRFLGEGGKKLVYLAHDELLDRDVAFALIKTEGLDETSRTRISREAQAMGRLGSHPHIVTVFDLGDHEGQPYMVTELMGGGDVEGIVEDAPDHKLPLEHAISIALATCRGLEFAHSRGIVHRDLKPGNVWLTADGIAKIGDFGLAVATDRSRLTQEGMMVGTVRYMPPEQAMGGEVTPKADLYSLGAMLYEMVCGRPPFLGDDSVAIIGQHINTPPVAPTWHRSDCPRPLEALIMRLLAKDPSGRPESASDVITVLESIDLTLSSEDLPQPDQKTNVLDGLASDVFVGRQKELGELKACLEEALSGRGRLVMLVGEPGIGKTRTSTELATYASLRGAQVLWGRCYEEQGVPPYWPWVQAIRNYVRGRDPAELSIEMGSGAVDIAQIVSDVREKLPGLPAPAHVEDPDSARFRLFDSIAAFLKTASQKQPLVLVLDDLHWADKPSLMLLQFVSRELSGTRLLLIGTYRDMELSRQHPLSEALGDLNRERLFQRILLRGLTPEDVERFIETTSGITPPRGLVSAVHTQTEGNPLFVTEVVRLLVQEGELTQEKVNRRDSWMVRIPEGVREVIGRRLNQLSQRTNETLTIASVIGREFTLQQLNGLIDDLTEEMVLDVLEEAIAARVIEELPTAVGRYQFTHALIQETLADELSMTRRVRLHARIAEMLEELYGTDAEARAAELAHHFAQAEAVAGNEKLVKYARIAGERALENFAHEDALVHFQRALAAKEGEPVDAETAATLYGLGRAQVATLPRHQIQDAVASFTRAFDFYAETGDVDRAVAIAEYPFYPVAGQRIGEAQLIARALELLPPDSHEAGGLLSRYGRVIEIEEGDYDSAQKAFATALSIAKREGDVALEMRTLADAANVDLYESRWQECLSKALRSIELAQRTDEPYTEILARYSAALAQCALGDLEGLRLNAPALLTLAERLRDRWWVASALRCNAFVSRLVGQWEDARDFSNRGLAVSPMEPRDLCSRTLLEYEVGNFDQGEVYLERLLEVMRMTEPGPALEYAYPAMTIPIIARITSATDRSEVARSASEMVVSSATATPLVTAIARAGLALLATTRNTMVDAEEQYIALEPHRGTILVFSMISVDRLLGMLSATLGRFEQATTHFEDSLAFCRKAGYRPELAWSLCDYADMLLERNAEGDRQKATALLDESLQISSDLGMRPLMERVLSRREILKA